METKKVYQFDDKKIYKGTLTLDASDKSASGAWNIPSDCVEIAPPAPQENTAYKWQGGAWVAVEDYRKKTNEEFSKQARILDAYRDKVNELGSEDVAKLVRLSAALKRYAQFRSDPYSALEDAEEGEGVFVCPACGTVNAPDATECSRCGRSKARSELLLAKGLIKQSPPVRRKIRTIPAEEADLGAPHTPTFSEFAGAAFEEAQNKPIEVESAEAGAGRTVRYPYGAMYGINPETGMPWQMPPIVQPVAFVPYVTQDQPLMQYTPTGEYIDEDGNSDK